MNCWIKLFNLIQVLEFNFSIQLNTFSKKFQFNSTLFESSTWLELKYSTWRNQFILDINEFIFKRLYVLIFIDFANIDSDSSKSENIIYNDFDLDDWSCVWEELRSALIFEHYCNEDDKELYCDILFTCDQLKFVSEVKIHDKKVNWLRKRIEYEHHY